MSPRKPPQPAPDRVSELIHALNENTAALRSVAAVIRETPEAPLRVRKASRKAAVIVTQNVVDKATVAAVSQRIFGTPEPPPLPLGRNSLSKY